MQRRSRQSGRTIIAAATAIVMALFGAAPAAASCAEGHVDFTDERSLWCRYSGSFAWSVPARVFNVEFWVVGASAPQASAGGIKAKLPVTPGDRLNLAIGGSGEASSIGRDGQPLLVAGGGNEATPNFIVPDAEVLSATDPGGPGNNQGGDGLIWAFWRADPPPPVNPLPSTIYDFFADETDGFFPTGGVQTWTAPENLEEVVFELRGGAGESGFPEGHVIATFSVRAGESFEIDVGGVGEATTLRRADTDELVARAAGGDDRTTNFLALWASGAKRYEGGGDEPFPWNGFAAVHQWMSASPPLPSDEDPPPAGPEPRPPADEAVSMPSPAVGGTLLLPPNVSIEGRPPREASPARQVCRVRGRRLSLRRCRRLAGRLTPQRAVTGPAVTSSAR